jgi:type 1 fimbria pilin
MHRRILPALLLTAMAGAAHGSDIEADEADDRRMAAYNHRFNDSDPANFLGALTVKFRGKLCAAGDDCRPAPGAANVTMLRATSNDPGCRLTVPAQVDLAPAQRSTIATIHSKGSGGFRRTLPDPPHGAPYQAPTFRIQLSGPTCPADLWISVTPQGLPGALRLENRRQYTANDGPLLALASTSTAQGVGIFLTHKLHSTYFYQIDTLLRLNTVNGSFDISRDKALPLYVRFAQTGDALQPGDAAAEVTFIVEKARAGQMLPAAR